MLVFLGNKKQLYLAVFLLFLSCEDEQDKYGALHIEINVTQDQGAAAAKITSSDIAKVTITISGMDPVNIDVSSGTNVSRTIEDVPIGEQTVTVDMKDSLNTIYYTQTQTVEVEPGETASPYFNDFTPENLSIELTSPNGGEIWAIGSSQTITWDSDYLSEDWVQIELDKNGSFYSNILAPSNSTYDSGSYDWIIPNTLTAGNTYTINIYMYGDNTVIDHSNANFTLTDPTPSITVTSPIGGDYWEVGHTKEITWISNNPPPNTKRN